MEWSTESLLATTIYKRKLTNFNHSSVCVYMLSLNHLSLYFFLCLDIYSNMCPYIHQIWTNLILFYICIFCSCCIHPSIFSVIFFFSVCLKKQQKQMIRFSFLKHRESRRESYCISRWVIKRTNGNVVNVIAAKLKCNCERRFERCIYNWMFLFCRYSYFSIS